MWQHLPGRVGKEPGRQFLGLCSSYLDVFGSYFWRSIRDSLPTSCLVLCELRIYSFPDRVSIACVVFSAKVGIPIVYWRNSDFFISFRFIGSYLGSE